MKSLQHVLDPCIAVPFQHHLAPRHDVSECALDDDEEFFPFNNGQKRIGGDGAKIMPREKGRNSNFLSHSADIFQTFYAPRFDG